MAPQDDVIIESAYADEYDVVYGDYNQTSTSMEMGGGLTPKPYIRLDSTLANVTRPAGDTIRMRCAAIASPLPIQFAWFKNNAPLEYKRNRRIKVKNRDYQSRLVIKRLEVLDSGYYRCEASNPVGTVDTTGVLKVSPASRALANANQPPPAAPQQPSELDTMDYSQTDRLLETMGSGQWLMAASVDGHSRRLRNNTCVAYGGQACAEYLQGLSVLITSPDIEHMIDIEREVYASGLFIDKHPTVTPECKTLSKKVGCLHRFTVCNPAAPATLQDHSHQFAQPAHQTPRAAPAVMRICQADCFELANERCRAEYSLARENGLIGDGANHLMPDCQALPSTSECLPVFSSESVDPTHVCYVGRGLTYKGQVHRTETGQQCQSWLAAGKRNSADASSSSSDAVWSERHNFCRNPDGRTQPWCVAMNGRAEPCSIPQCGPGLLPQLVDRERQLQTKLDAINKRTQTSLPPAGGAPGDASSGQSDVMGQAKELWTGLAPHWQYSLMGGAAGLALLLLLLCCCLCGRRRRRSSPSKKRQSNGGGHNEAPLLKINGSTAHINGVTNNYNNGYARKLNGSAYSGSLTGTGSGQHAPVELSALLNNNNQPSSQHNNSSPPPLSHTVVQIDGERLKFIEPLGEGQFGKVWKGELLYSQNDEPVQVAIKTLKDDTTARDMADFDHEIQFASQLQHPNVVSLLGVCATVRPKCAVFEYMIHGDLHEFLMLRSPFSVNERGETVNTLDRERLVLDQNDFLHISTQIASGMEFLASCHYIHRDLATRNCLVTDRLVIKICDFGLMRECYTADYYRMQSRTMLPVRWMPVEAIMYGQFSEHSDVWAYGVTLWEIYNYGQQPYFGYTNEQVIELVRNRCLLECPQNCPPRMYSVMVECWHEQASRRPRFQELHARITNWSISSPAQSSALASQHAAMPRPASVNSGATSSATGGLGRGSKHSSSVNAPGPIRGYNNLVPQTNVPSPPPSYTQATNKPMPALSSLNGCNGQSPRMQHRQIQPLRPSGYPDSDFDSSDADA